MSNFRTETKCVQSGWDPKNGEPRVEPIVQSTTYKYESCDAMAKLFDLEDDGFFYTRLANPTATTPEIKVSDLEGGVGAMLCSSGQAAVLAAILNISKAGDHIVSTSAIYGGTFNLFDKTLRQMGIDVTFISPDADEKEIEGAIRDNTRLLYGETIANPALVVLDIETYAKVAHAHNIPLIVDNTFATPINCRPFEFGADIVVHSTTKYMDGHATSVGGMIVDSGNFDWTKGNFPELTTPDETYHGVVYTERFGRAAYITKARTHLMRDLGMSPAPLNAFLLNLGLETLHLRMPRHCENAQKVAEFLLSNDKVESVNYPGLKGDKYYDLAKKYLPNGTCGVISFVIKGGRDAAVRVLDNLKLAAIVTHVADARTCVLHPASTTHRQLSEQALIDCGIQPGMVRLSVGIENVDDIIEDLKQALENA